MPPESENTVWFNNRLSNHKDSQNHPSERWAFRRFNTVFWSGWAPAPIIRSDGGVWHTKWVVLPPIALITTPLPWRSDTWVNSGDWETEGNTPDTKKGTVISSRTWRSKEPLLSIRFENIEVPRKGLFMYVYQKWPKHYLQAWEDGVTVLHSITSLWTPWHPTPAINRRKIPWNTERSHISSLYPINKKTGARWWARMDFATHIKGNIFIHAGATTGTPLSHGCIRLPRWKAQTLYNIVNQAKRKQKPIYVEVRP
jgi:hypothetical protein